MIKVSCKTKKGQALASRAQHYEGFYLDSVYGSYSSDKGRAWQNCYELCAKENGSNFHICSHSTHTFSVSWRVDNGWRMETRDNSYFIEDYSEGGEN